MSKVALVALLAALVLPVAGCAEGSSPGAAGAGIAPEGAKVFVTVDTSFDSPNWEAGRSLLAKFPDEDQAVSWLMEQLGSQGVDFEQDVKPALGPETDLVGLDLSGEGTFVGLTQPEDRAKLDALLAKSNQPLVAREIDGWVAFSDSEGNLDEFERMREDGTLEGADAYQAVSDQVAANALVHVYVAPSALASTQMSYFKPLLGSEAAAFALSLKPEDDGIHVEGAASPATSDFFSDEFEAELPGKVPGGVYLYAGTSDLERQLGALRDALAEAAPEFDRDLAHAEAELGVSLDADVFPLFSGESALYIRPGFPIPEVTIVTEVEDEQGAMATMDKLANAVTEYAEGARVESVDTAGVQAKRVSLNQFVSVDYATFDGHLVITTSRQGITDFKSSENRLAGDEVFNDATAGMPDETTGFLYINLSKALPALFGLMGLSMGHVPEQAQANVEPLQSLVLYGERDGDVAKFSGLLSIQ